MTSLKLGLIGCGSIAQRGILPHLALPDAQEIARVTAVCDVVAERARETAGRFGIPAWYGSLRQLLDEVDIDAVLIATPIPTHFEYALTAVKAGKHVYIQKTMTTTTSEADILIAAARETGVRLVAAPGQTLTPVLQRLRQALQEELIGRPYWAFASTAFTGHEFESFRTENPVDPGWYYRLGGGPIYDMAVYSLHTLTGLLGPAWQVTAMSGIRLPQRSWFGGGVTVEMDDNTVLLLDFDGCYAVVGGHFCRTGRVIGWGFTGIYGSTGTVEITALDGGTAFPGQFELANGRQTSPEEVPQWLADPIAVNHRFLGEAHAAMPEAHIWAEIRHLVNCVANNQEPMAGGEHARHVIEIIEKGYEAAQSGRTQTLKTSFSNNYQNLEE
jgi:predicted dehydrogenase